MTQAIVLHAHGGPEQLRAARVEVGAPGAGEVRLRHTGIGVNFVDTYFRRGLYPVELPAIIGDQACGVVEAVGPGVDGLAVGDAVAYASCPGAYAATRIAPAAQLVRVPAGVDAMLVASSLTRGMTAEYLLFRLHALARGESCLVYAAAGGTGRLLCQWARHLGATVIAAVGAANRVATAHEAGAHHVLLNDDADFAARVRAWSGGRGVDVVYDSVGRDTFTQSLACLRPRGLMVAYGNASGAPEPCEVLALARHGSLFLTRPRLPDYVADRSELEHCAGRYFDALAAGVVRPNAIERYALADAAAAHLHLEDRERLTTPVLVP
ncbi:MAG: quinone oxidoreductase [Gammaproteobacteria bacterium]